MPHSRHGHLIAKPLGLSLGTRLALAISGVLFILIVPAGLWLEQQLTRALQQEDLVQAEAHTKTLLASLQTLMLNGQGTLAREWLNRMRGTAGIIDIGVLRRDGREAFNDLDTVEQVNKFIGQLRFERAAVVPAPPVPYSQSAFNSALQGRLTIDRTPGNMTVMVPIAAKTECLSCHGYDASPLRGVLRLSISTAVADTRLETLRRNLWLIAVTIVALLGLSLWVALRYSVLRPIRRLRNAIARVGRGDRHTTLPEENSDEIGEVARVFNRMQADLHAAEAHQRAVMDNVVDAIITIDTTGVIQSCNPAVQTIFGYTRDELLGQNIKILMPEPYRSLHDEYLARYARSGKTHIFGSTRELTGMRKDGTVFPMDLAVSEMRIAGQRHYIGILRDITERKLQTAALEHQALHDGLTGLPNRILLSDRLSQAIRRASRESSHLALMLLDLDRFKEINDTLGHHVGDQVLQHTARRLCAELRESDTVARLGGDEFAVLLPTADLEHAVRIAKKLIDAVEQPYPLENQTLHIGASFGIALYPDHGDDEGVLMRHADVAMYVAKRASLGYAIYDPAKDRHSLRNLAMMGELKAAMERDDLVLYYQPKIHLASGHLIGVEALVRWHHSTYGLMFPDGFVPVAEQGGMVTSLTFWVITQALEQCRLWHQEGIIMNIAVNVSARNLLDTQFPTHIAKLLPGDCRPSRSLRLEITETAIMEDPARAMSILQTLSDMGVGLSIDDFGTGYSSLAYLKQLPIDEIKIDKSFVIGMHADENDAVIVRSTIDLAHNIGLTVVAEGVEDQETFERLKSLGCDVAQGHYIGRPLPAAEFAVWLQNSPWQIAENDRRI